MTGWSVAQIAALAPDAGSVAAARRLGGCWSRTGTHGTLLWGLCEGSAARPYETVVDVSGPSFACSCPSRKTPCKHVLGLLIAWSEDAVPEADSVPPCATERLAAARAQQANRAPATPNPATVRQRAERVSAGLADLDTWLLDQIRTGLAQADRSFAGIDAIAARMVDAQAPAVASALRRIPYMVAAQQDWPQRLLAEYASLHLLVEAHRRIGELPEPLAAAVRSHVGYPMKAETVLTMTAVDDTWMVLASRITEENQLYTRKTWLRGRVGRTWAVLLDFSYGSPGFPRDVPDVGLQFDASVHYYPGSAELRAKLGERRGRPQPFTTLPAESIDDALAAYAAAVGADPWVRSWPVLLRDVVPTVSGEQWRAVDAGGVSVPIGIGTDDARPWTLLAISGGHPVTLVGEWNGSAVFPVAVFSQGQAFAL